MPNRRCKKEFDSLCFSEWAARLREAKIASGLTMRQIREATGCATTTMMKVFQGKGCVLLRHITAIAQAVGLRLDIVFAPIETPGQGGQDRVQVE